MTTTPPPPPPPPGQQPQWNTPQSSGYQQTTREHPSGTTVLVLGILGLVLCGVLAPVAWIKGNAAQREMDAQPNVNWTNRGSVTTGRILGIVGTVIILLGIVFVIIAFAALGSTT